MGPSPGPEQVLRVQRREAGHVTSARVPSLIRKSRGFSCADTITFNFKVSMAFLSFYQGNDKLV